MSDVMSLIKWVRLIQLLRPDTTLIGTPKAALLGNFAAQLFRVKRRIYLLHGLRLETSVGIKRSLLRLIERVTSRMAHETLAVSASLRQLAIRSADIRENNILVLGAGSCNGIDIEKYRTSVLNLDQKRSLANTIKLDPTIPTVGFVGRITKDKGLTQLAGAMRLLYSRGVTVQLLIIGPIDGKSGTAAIAELEGTHQAVIATGYREDPAPFYQLMDVFCLPSLREGLPGVILEAMASRTAVVGTDATGIVDVIEDGVTGLVVARGSDEELASALETLILSHARRDALTENAFDMVSVRFNTPRVQGLLRDFLRSRHANRGRRPFPATAAKSAAGV